MVRLAVIPYEGPFVCEGKFLRKFWTEQIVEPVETVKSINLKRGELIDRVVRYLSTFGPQEHWQITVGLDADYVKIRAVLGYLVCRKRLVNIDHKYQIVVKEMA